RGHTAHRYAVHDLELEQFESMTSAQRISSRCSNDALDSLLVRCNGNRFALGGAAMIACVCREDGGAGALNARAHGLASALERGRECRHNSARRAIGSGRRAGRGPTEARIEMPFMEKDDLEMSYRRGYARRGRDLRGGGASSRFAHARDRPRLDRE